MKITKVAKAGTLESNDILIIVMPNESGKVQLELESIVLQQLGEVIEQVILHKVEEMGVEGITIKAQDKGALDYTIGARVETAIKRAIQQTSSNFSKLLADDQQFIGSIIR